MDAAVRGEGGLNQLDKPLLDFRRGHYLCKCVFDGHLYLLVVEQSEGELLAAALQRLDRLLRSYLHEVPILKSRHKQM